jgi:peptidoglycan/xylan/chitin deacetylase (PgdA/CDA1 family)
MNLINQAGTGPAGSHTRTGSADVALTFDDGPDPTLTPKILDLLKANGIKATFCLVGKQVKQYPNLVRRIAAEGHTLCDHTYSHQNDLGKQSTAAMTKELVDTLELIQAAAPGTPIQYFRAPGGNYTPALVAVAHSLGLTSIYWAVDPRDWDNQHYGTGARMVDHIVAVVESRTGPGAIVLSHDLKVPDTITAYATLLPWLKARFTLVCLPVVPI